MVLTPPPPTKPAQAKVSAHGVVLAPRSVLVLDGADITLKNLRVSGTLVVRAAPGARVVVDGLVVSNAGWEWAHTEEVRRAGFALAFGKARPPFPRAVACGARGGPVVQWGSSCASRCLRRAVLCPGKETPSCERVTHNARPG